MRGFTRYLRADGNQEQIVSALRKVGAFVQITSTVGHGFPDLVCGYRGVTYLLEIKSDGIGIGRKGDGDLTEEQIEWHLAWRGGPLKVVCSVKDALDAIGCRANASRI